MLRLGRYLFVGIRSEARLSATSLSSLFMGIKVNILVALGRSTLLCQDRVFWTILTDANMIRVKRKNESCKRKRKKDKGQN